MKSLILYCNCTKDSFLFFTLSSANVIDLVILLSADTFWLFIDLDNILTIACGKGFCILAHALSSGMSAIASQGSIAGDRSTFVESEDEDENSGGVYIGWSDCWFVLIHISIDSSLSSTLFSFACGKGFCILEHAMSLGMLTFKRYSNSE